MRISSLFAATLLVAGVSLTAKAAETLRVGGTGSSLGMLRQVGDEFSAASGIAVDVVPSLGSTGGIRALADGKLDVAVSARPLKPAEAAKDLRLILTLRTPFVLATSHREPSDLKSTELAALFASAQPKWADGEPIRLILRPRSETDTKLVGELFPGMAPVIEDLRKRAEIPIAATDQDNADMAQRLPGSLTGTTLAQLTTEKRPLTIVKLDGVDPTLENFESGKYRFGKNLYFIMREKDVAAARQFIAFLRSPKGENALRKAGTLAAVE